VHAQEWKKSSRQLVQDLADYHSMDAEEIVHMLASYQQKHPEQAPHIFRWMCGDDFWRLVCHSTTLLSTVVVQASLMLACVEPPVSSRGLMDKLVLLFLDSSFWVVCRVCNCMQC